MKRLDVRRECRCLAVRVSTLGFLVIAACATLQVVAEALPTRGLLDPRVRVAPYSTEQVYHLYGFVGYQIDLEFEPGETFLGLAAGDIKGLTFIAQDNHLFLKPKAASVGTNLTVLTSRRHYQFDYVALAHRPDLNVDEVIYALRFTYPPTPAGTSTADRTDKALEQGSSARARNTDYWFCGAAALRPIAASDDGVHTRLRFNASAELPALFVRNDDASESLLNFSMDEGDVIVHRVARQFLVRRGRLVGCIVNKGFHGAGERLKSHTVSPQVERSTKPPGSKTGAADPTIEGVQP